MLCIIERWLEPSEKIKAIVDPIFRGLTSLIFIIGGLGHFGQHEMMLGRIEGSPWRGVVYLIGDPSILLWLSGAVFIGAGITLAVGFLTRASALVLFLTLIPITIAVHLVSDPEHVGPLFKNIAILGALLTIWARGPGAFALDHWANRRASPS